MHKIIYFFPENMKKSKVSPVNLGRVGLPQTKVFFIWPYKLLSGCLLWWVKVAYEALVLDSVTLISQSW